MIKATKKSHHHVLRDGSLQRKGNLSEGFHLFPEGLFASLLLLLSPSAGELCGAGLLALPHAAAAAAVPPPPVAATMLNSLQLLCPHGLSMPAIRG